MNKIEKFKNKEITIRLSKKEDIKNAAKFQKYVNELAEDDQAYISVKEKQSLKQEREYIKNLLTKVNKQQLVVLIAEDKNKIVGKTQISLGKGPQQHVGGLGIAVLKDYRGIGLGKYFLSEILKLAKKKLKPKPKMIRLSVASVNKVAISLYKKMGFKEVARIPKQFKYKEKICDEIVMLKDL